MPRPNSCYIQYIPRYLCILKQFLETLCISSQNIAYRMSYRHWQDFPPADCTQFCEQMRNQLLKNHFKEGKGTPYFPYCQLKIENRLLIRSDDHYMQYDIADDYSGQAWQVHIRKSVARRQEQSCFTITIRGGAAVPSVVVFLFGSPRRLQRPHPVVL